MGDDRREGMKEGNSSTILRQRSPLAASMTNQFVFSSLGMRMAIVHKYGLT
jgi:hypothetical protein